MKRSLPLILPFALALSNAMAQPYLPADLMYAMNVCSDTSFISTDLEHGAVLDLNNTTDGCLATGEVNGTWLQFRMATAGTIGFTLQCGTPTDLDFAVWGPFVEPPSSIGTYPIRCSWSAVSSGTGMGNGAIDQSEGAGGDSWVNTINAQAGEVYVLYAMNFSRNGEVLNLTWQMTNGATIECLPAPQAAFAASASTIMPGETISFTDLTLEDPFAWEWSFVGATPPTSSERDPQGVLYAEPGCYDVNLTAYNAVGQSTLNTTCQVLVELSTGELERGSALFTVVSDGSVVSISAADGAPFTVEVLDALGRYVRSERGAGRMDLTDLPAGWAMLRVRGASGTYVHRAVVF